MRLIESGFQVPSPKQESKMVRKEQEYHIVDFARMVIKQMLMEIDMSDQDLMKMNGSICSPAVFKNPIKWQDNTVSTHILVRRSLSTIIMISFSRNKTRHKLSKLLCGVILQDLFPFYIFMKDLPYLKATNYSSRSFKKDS